MVYHRVSDRTKLSDFAKGKIDVANYWAKYHQTQNDPEKIQTFRADEKIYDSGNFIRNWPMAK